MEWLDAWSGFEGEGMYAIINKQFQQSLSFAELPDNRYLTGSYVVHHGQLVATHLIQVRTPSSFRNIGYPGLVLDLEEAVPGGAHSAILRPECESEGDRAEERQCHRSQQWYLQKQTSEILLQIADDWSKVFLEHEKATSTERSDSGDEK
ncbi:MAG: hypothetical protein L6R37_005813 [Teloschistes peruensis]|nr:MAG: hypothetical protein L6R37_005813 [Teloschistes peruensis]